jgi:hypothetical protein
MVNGQRYRRSTKQRTRSKAQETALLMKQGIGRDGIPTRKGPVPTLRQFAETQFLKLIGANQTIAPNTRRCYLYGWQLLSSQPIAGMKLDCIRPAHIDTISTPGGPSTANTALRTLRRLLNLAVELDVIGKAPKFSLRQERRREKLVDPDAEAR